MGFLGLGAILIAFAGALGDAALRARRWRKIRLFWLRAASAGVLMLLGGASLWLSVSRPAPLFPVTTLGPGWECSISGSGASVCWRDVPPALHGQWAR